ncbi:MAG TPA: aminotransferase class IV [Solirubrobacteraceae bacterium]
MPATPPDRPDPAGGVYETVRVRDGAIQRLPAHLARLAHSLQELYGLPLTDEPRRRLLERAAGLLGEHRIRVNAVPGAGELRFELVASALTPDAPRPVSVTPVVVPGGLGAHKWCDRRLVERHGADPVPLLVDEHGTVLEGAWGNFWVLDGEQLITPPADGRILPGVTRAALLELAPKLGLRAREQPIALADAQRGAPPTIFLTSSLRLAVAAGFGPPPPEPPEIARIRDALAVF